jgi:lactate racemase
MRSRSVRVPYGTSGLEIQLPESADVIDPVDPPALPDEAAAVSAAARAPLEGPGLGDLVAGARSVLVVFPDITRPMPNHTVLPPLLAELESAGAGPDKVELICATGTHRRTTPDEMASLVGREILSRYAVHDHSATEDEHVNVGRVDGSDVRIDRRYVDAEVRILTGFVEPHFFAGFSGGPKGACPGLADIETVLEAHSRARIADPRSTWTVMDQNPVHDFVRQAVALCPPTLSLDVTIDRRRRLTGVFCGPLHRAHRAACESVISTSVSAVDGPYDVVVSTNGGYPLDRNLYQAVKGMAAAERVVAAGGTILMAAECCDGLPAGGAFERILARSGNAEDLLAGGPRGKGAEPAPGSGERVTGSAPAEPDGWQAQVLGRVLTTAQVGLKSTGLDEASIRMAQLRPVDDLNEEIRIAMSDHGRDSRLCVLVRGPLAVATNRMSDTAVRD